MTTSTLSAISPDDVHRILARQVFADGLEADTAREIVHKSLKEL
jgi:hypothetical protein